MFTLIWFQAFLSNTWTSQKFCNILETDFLYSSHYNKSNQAFKVKAILLLCLKPLFYQFFNPTLIPVLFLWFPKVSGVYTGLFEWYDVLHCLAAEELAFCQLKLGIFPTAAVQSKGWHQWFDFLEWFFSELPPSNFH